jgi:asparagine synthase (glutamine-hydrolysing)
MTLPWLAPEIRRAVTARLARELSSAPLTWSGRMRWSARWRAWRAAAHSVAIVGAEHGATVHSPFLDPRFFAALAGAGGRWGWGDRTATMRVLFSDVLPEAVIARETKAEFSEPFFGPHTRRFAQRWDGHSGLDGLVDGEVIRRVWTAAHPHGMSGIALQAAWLASDRAEAVDVTGHRSRDMIPASS